MIGFTQIIVDGTVMHPKHRQTLDTFLNSDSFNDKYEFIQVVKYYGTYHFIILARFK
jgi:hypothetical protein